MVLLLQYLAGMLLGIDLLATYDVLDLPRGTNHEGRALRTHVLPSVHTLLDPSAKQFV